MTTALSSRVFKVCVVYLGRARPRQLHEIQGRIRRRWNGRVSQGAQGEPAPAEPARRGRTEAGARREQTAPAAGQAELVRVAVASAAPRMGRRARADAAIADGGADRPGTRALGGACTGDQDCASSHCAGTICCDQSCTGPCAQCSSAGQCQMPADDPACGTIARPADTACRDWATSITASRCKAVGQCKAAADCTIRQAPAKTYCGLYQGMASVAQVCDRIGNCGNPTVTCGADGECSTIDHICCATGVASASCEPEPPSGAQPCSPNVRWRELRRGSRLSARPCLLLQYHTRGEQRELRRSLKLRHFCPDLRNGDLQSKRSRRVSGRLILPRYWDGAAILRLQAVSIRRRMRRRSRTPKTFESPHETG